MNNVKDNTNTKDLTVGLDDKALFSFLYKKTERLTTALYLITNFLSDNEPLKWRLRDLGVILLSGISSVTRATTANRSEVLSSRVSTIDEIVSLVDMAKMAGLISEMNATLLSREFNSLGQVIESRKNSGSPIGDIKISAGFLSEPNALIENTKSIGHNELQKDKEAQISSVKKQYSDNNTEFINHTYGNKQATVSGRQSAPKEGLYKRQTNKIVTDVKNRRRGTITALLKRTKNLTIKDIAISIPDCSEKTIQRELISMIKDNIIKREGERRWSKYSLV